MPITGVLITCREGEAVNTRSAIQSRSHSEVMDGKGNMLVVVTDTASLEEDRKEIDWLSSLPGVVSALVAYTNIEDLTGDFSAAGERA